MKESDNKINIFKYNVLEDFDKINLLTKNENYTKIFYMATPKLVENKEFDSKLFDIYYNYYCKGFYFLIENINKNKNDLEKIIDFPKYVPNNSLKLFLIRYELIKLIKEVPGDIIECGVCGGRGLFSLLQSHLILEPKFFLENLLDLILLMDLLV